MVTVNEKFALLPQERETEASLIMSNNQDLARRRHIVDNNTKTGIRGSFRLLPTVKLPKTIRNDYRYKKTVARGIWTDTKHITHSKPRAHRPPTTDSRRQATDRRQPSPETGDRRGK